MVSSSIVTLLFLVCLQTVLLSTISNCAKTISMYWNTTNSIFRIDNTDHIIDVNKNNAKFEYDQVNIICPVYQPGTYDDEAEKYIIYNVSKEEYETCRITNPTPRIIANCDKPFKTVYFTITFRPFTPQPGGLEFHPGRDYYFISTSSKDDLHRRIGGRCTTHNMKVVFKVCCGNEADSSSYPATSRNNSVAVTSSTVSSSSSSSSTSVAVLNGNINANHGYQQPGSANSPAVYKGGERLYPVNPHNPIHRNEHSQQQPDLPAHVPQQPTYLGYPPHQTYVPPASQPPKNTVTQKKKNKEYSDHPNEVVKNEELTYNSGGTARALISPTSQRQQQQWLAAWTLALLCSAFLPQLLMLR
ncbi:ephrin-B2 [Copidosoma floridanum]|uniref:ephrin-B2 n=1 Tax=Copidosoma floridanum TaxID=29053 RepID=UPI0006C96915|nr:ephrin-B2 [Copidosoma floridanum]